MSAITKDICELSRNRRSPEELLAGLVNRDRHSSTSAAQALLSECQDYGLPLDQFLTLAIDPTKSEQAARYGELNGLEASFAYLGLPVRNDFEAGVVLQAAANTFSTYDGTRALFPAVVDQMLRWQNRINMIESVEPMLANSRTIAGNELVTTIVNDDSDARTTNTVAELAGIPVKTVRTSEQSVKLYKHGSGYRFSYEFGRRASLDVLTPFAARVARELELSKVRAATGLLINGDGVQGAAPVVGSSTYGDTVHDGSIRYRPFLKWLVARAAAGVPVDVVIGNYSAYADWLLLFTPTLAAQTSEAKALIDAGVGPNLLGNLPALLKPVQFVISSGVPDGQIIGYTRAETLEELVEAGSSIVESERAVLNQAVTYVRSEVTGYKLVFGDTRSVLNFSA